VAAVATMTPDDLHALGDIAVVAAMVLLIALIVWMMDRL
jgi:preprotein translocase subunit SecE